MITARELTAVLGPTLVEAPLRAPSRHRHAVVDSRRAGRGDLFVALRGERVDGHDFAADAAAHGATGAIVERRVEAPLAQYVVPDALAALQSLARARRAARRSLRVVAVTGSVGKTTTKELVAGVLANRYRVLKSEGNLNSEIGLPLVLLELTSRQRRAVLEMGMWAPGEIALLCQLARPDVGIVTNVGPSHLERMGSIDAVADAKAELVEALPPDGVAVLNADDPRVLAMAGRTRAHVVTYGLASADVRALDIDSHGLAGVSFTLAHGDAREPVYTRLPGRAMVYNALAAAAAGLVDGLPLADVAAALSAARIAVRVQAHRGPNGSTIVDDAYNASPASMQAALDVLGEAPGRKIAVLGDMRELGAEEAFGHREIGERAAEVADTIIAVGPLGRLIGEAARAVGHTDVRFFAEKDGLAASLEPELAPGDVVLFKASRALELETVVQALAVRERTSDSTHTREASWRTR